MRRKSYDQHHLMFIEGKDSLPGGESQVCSMGLCVFDCEGYNERSGFWHQPLNGELEGFPANRLG